MTSRQGTDPADRPTWVDRIENPCLHGIHAPTVHETTGAVLMPSNGLGAQLPPAQSSKVGF